MRTLDRGAGRLLMHAPLPPYVLAVSARRAVPGREAPSSLHGEWSLMAYGSHQMLLSWTSCVQGSEQHNCIVKLRTQAGTYIKVCLVPMVGRPCQR